MSCSTGVMLGSMSLSYLTVNRPGSAFMAASANTDILKILLEGLPLGQKLMNRFLMAS